MSSISKKVANHKKSKKLTSKSKTGHNEEEKKELGPLTLSKLKSILESPSHRANRSVLRYKNFVKQALIVLSKLSCDERHIFLNQHLNEKKLNKWTEKKSKFMDISKCSFQHTPLSISFYNFTYAHSSKEVSKIWYNFI